jgi:hypothetical protein
MCCTSAHVHMCYTSVHVLHAEQLHMCCTSAHSAAHLHMCCTSAQDYVHVLHMCCASAHVLHIYVIEDGEHCIRSHAFVDDILNLAKAYYWLEMNPDPASRKTPSLRITDRGMVEEAIWHLNGIYEDHGVHEHDRVYGLLADCHSNIGQVEYAIYYRQRALETEHRPM